jgi:hypothetical protein
MYRTPYTMTLEAIHLPFPLAHLSHLCLDLNDDGEWMAIIDDSDGLRLKTATKDIPIDLDGICAMVRWLDDKALIVCGVGIAELSAVIVDTQTGAILKRFSVGEGVQDVVVLEDFIAFSYYDEGVYSDNRISNEGISIFDQNGAFRWGYHNGVPGSVQIADCYAICKTGRNRIAFCAYTDFPFVELDLDTRHQTVIPTPTETHGSGAITVLPDTVFLHGPIPKGEDWRTAERDGIYAMDKDTGKVTEVGSVTGKWVRGLSRGRMLSVTDNAVSIIRLTEQAT